MNRRMFFKSAAAFAVLPTLPALACAEAAEAVDMTLRMRYLPAKPNSFCGKRLEISKGPYKTIVNTEISDCVDSHGLCATDELLWMVASEFELGEENVRKIYSWDYSFSLNEEELKARMKKIHSMRRFRLTMAERAEIHAEFVKLRGPHNCVHHYTKSKPLLVYGTDGMYS